MLSSYIEQTDRLTLILKMPDASIRKQNSRVKMPDKDNTEVFRIGIQDKRQFHDLQSDFIFFEPQTEIDVIVSNKKNRQRNVILQITIVGR